MMNDAPTYVFPLWCTYDEGPRLPLGAILLDMRYYRSKNIEESTLATKLLLDLVSDILASRHYKRRIRGTLGTLMDSRHNDGDYMKVWESFKTKFVNLLDYIPPRRECDDDPAQKARVVVDEANDLAAKMQRSLDAHHTAMTSARKYIDPEHNQMIRDLGAHLAETADACRLRFDEQGRRSSSDSVSLVAARPPPGDLEHESVASGR